MITALALMAMLAAPVRAQDASAALTGNWQGTYTCAQGKTGLTLTIDRQEGSTFSGVFQFYPLRENITVPEGCFTVSGRIRSGGAFDIAGSAWIKRPAGYITVDLHGRVGQGGTNMSGTVETPGYGRLCSRFDLTRTTTKPSIDNACRIDAPAVSFAPQSPGISLAAAP
ncbi:MULTISPECIES: hypothetical protein [unclassified Bosea (in: a-proteobacteria)]|uniref:hypothetical protein n=1 Tax=unclassified Bosea (in: a-proteobacteria) TaxID=2653178 RepID=UPI00125EC352|nr:MULTISPECIES: hypothetical protein [unclassified Bosea (in: a-proteobacteria)]